MHGLSLPTRLRLRVCTCCPCAAGDTTGSLLARALQPGLSVSPLVCGVLVVVVAAVAVARWWQVCGLVVAVLSVGGISRWVCRGGGAAFVRVGGAWVGYIGVFVLAHTLNVLGGLVGLCLLWQGTS